MKTQSQNTTDVLNTKNVTGISNFFKTAYSGFFAGKFLLVAAILLLSSFVTSTPTGQLRGVVVSEGNEKIISGAQLALFQNDKEVWSFTLGSNGVFSAAFPVGSYSLKVTAPGYKTYVNRSVNITSATDTYVKVVLIPETPTEKKELEKDVVLQAVSDSRVGRTRGSDNVKTEASYYAPATPAGYSGNYVSEDVGYVEHNTESYDVINENIFKDAVNNPLSTFSIDVDRASYSNVRRYLAQNQKPPKDAVRIEELINYFDYDYPQPDNGHPFSVTIEHTECPWNNKNQLVLIGLKGENKNETQIPANNLVFLIDVSGSMGYANKLPLLKQSFKYLVNNLRPQDKVAIVVYAGAAGLVLPSTSGNEKSKINDALDNLNAGGSTAGGEGIILAYKVAKENFIRNGNNRVILASDGDFNVGASSDAEMVRLIESKRDDGIFLTILGFGMGNYKDSKMETLSNAGNGNYAYIDNILEAKKMFGTELWGTLYTIAKDVKIQVEFNPAYVKGYRLVGYENRMLNKEDFNNDKKDAGDIGCGHTVTALYEIVPADSEVQVSDVDPLEYQTSKVLKSTNAMTVKVRYKKPDENTSILSRSLKTF